MKVHIIKLQKHTSGDFIHKFMLKNLEGGVSVMYYRAVKENETVDVEYGKEFTTAQEVFDFIVNYGRYLESKVGYLIQSVQQNTRNI